MFIVYIVSGYLHQSILKYLKEVPSPIVWGFFFWGGGGEVVMVFHEKIINENIS